PPPPPPPPPEPYRRPTWMRPDDVLGEAVPINFVLARTPRAAVTVQHITAYPTGFEFDVVVAARIEGEIWDPMHGLGGFRGRPGHEIDAALIREAATRAIELWPESGR